MGTVCIVTDSTAQLPQLSGATGNVIVLPMISILKGSSFDGGDIRRAGPMPVVADDTLAPHLAAPSAELIYQTLAQLTGRYTEFLLLLSSAQLSQMFENAVKAADSLRGRVDIQVIDTQTVSLGLGFLVEYALEAVRQGKSLAEIELSVRGMLPRIYGILCTQGPSYLYYNGFIDKGQAVVTEMLGLLPIFAIEEGRFSPLEKVKNYRNTINFFQEYIDEFDHLNHIALLQGNPPVSNEIQFLRDHIHEAFPRTPFTTHHINLSLATLLGPRTLGLFLIEGQR